MLVDLIKYFNTFDYILVMIMLSSVFAGVTRGMVRETCYIAGWLIALFLSYYKLDLFTGYVYPYISYTELANLVTVLLIFMIVVAIFQIIGWLLATMLRTIGLGIVDRIFGVILGILRGTLVSVLLILIINAIFGETTWLRESVLMMYFSDLVLLAESILPSSLLNTFQSSDWYQYVQVDSFEPIVGAVENAAEGVMDTIQS